MGNENPRRTTNRLHLSLVAFHSSCHASSFCSTLGVAALNTLGCVPILGRLSGIFADPESLDAKIPPNTTFVCKSPHGSTDGTSYGIALIPQVFEH
jgi:hypothetical protein